MVFALLVCEFSDWLCLCLTADCAGECLNAGSLFSWLLCDNACVPSVCIMNACYCASFVLTGLPMAFRVVFIVATNVVSSCRDTCCFKNVAIGIELAGAVLAVPVLDVALYRTCWFVSVMMLSFFVCEDIQCLIFCGTTDCACVCHLSFRLFRWLNGDFACIPLMDT